MTDDLVARVKEANDVVEVIGSSVALRQAGKIFKGLCPFHEDHRPSFDVDPHRQRYRCWSCGKHGDVISFVMEQDRVDFLEALELLARRAGISLEKSADSPHRRNRAAMLKVVRWAAEQYHHCLLNSPLADAARQYVGERKLTGETVRRFTLGYAPMAGDWLVKRAAQAGQSVELLEQVGLLAQREEKRGYYDRFRDRIIFPIRDVRGQTVGFGGRILPSSPLSARAPKYYNSSGTPLFTKGEHLYGLDEAKQAAGKVGYLAVVEGYTDVLMAQQMGIAQVVSTMGTALTAKHVQNLLRWVPEGRVVLVFDADAGGSTGVDRALELFVSQDVDLSIATLPEGMDPCDLLVKEGPETFQRALADAVDALDFKLKQVLAGDGAGTLEGQRRAVDAVLGIIALAPEMTGQTGAVKQQLIVSRIARRLGLQEPTIWKRLGELRARRAAAARPRTDSAEPEKQSGPADVLEKELLQVLLAVPRLVPVAASHVGVNELAHPGLKKLLQGLYDLHARGEPAELDQLRPLIASPALIETAMTFQEVGRLHKDPAAWLDKILAAFSQRRLKPRKQELQNQLQAACDHTEAVELLRQLQIRTVSSKPGARSQESGVRSQESGVGSQRSRLTPDA